MLMMLMMLAAPASYCELGLRLRYTGQMDTQCCAHNRLKMYCEQLAKNCSVVYYFSRMTLIFSGKILFLSQQSNLYHLLEGLTRAFCDISYGFQESLFQTCKTEILEARPRYLSNSFDNQNNYSKKALVSPSAVFVW